MPRRGGPSCLGLCSAQPHISVLSDGWKALASQQFISHIFDIWKQEWLHVKFCRHSVVWLSEFKMPLDPEGKPLGKESKECASRRQPSCLSTCLHLLVLPLLGTLSRDSALVTAWPARTSWRQPHNPWLLSAQDLCRLLGKQRGCLPHSKGAWEGGSWEIFLKGSVASSIWRSFLKGL